MNYVRIVDTNGLFVEDAFVAELTQYTIITPVPEINPLTGKGFYWPKWDFVSEQWVEGRTQAEINALNNTPKKPSTEDRLAAIEEALLTLI